MINEKQHSNAHPMGQSVGPVEIHTMPEKFIATKAPVIDQKTGQPSVAHGSKASWIIIAVIIVAVVAILGGAGYLIYSNIPSGTDAIVSNENSNENTNQQANSNENSNTNNEDSTNKNSNKNTNTNSNDNVNKNNSKVNSNTNTNTNNNNNTNTNTNENTNTASEPKTTKKVVIAQDKDIDGLSVAEEKIYGTKVDKPDTDADGYKDGSEIINGYNPAGAGTITDSNLAKTYKNNTSEYGYTIIYPANWIAEIIKEGGGTLIFTPDDVENAGEFIEVAIEKNSYGFSAIDWYLDQNKDFSVNDVEQIEVNGIEGMLTVNGTTAYFADSNYIYVVSYSYGNKTEVNFMSTFTMMYKSFKITKPKKISTDINANSNDNTNIN
ncbi:MAG: hypothetical protein V1898_02645 [Patescibacteria group bacterium]